MIESHGATDIGKKRQRNEDSFALNRKIQMFVVADGMGGHNAGDVASSTAVKTIENFLVRSLIENDPTWPFGTDPKFTLEGNLLRTALKLANHRVWQLADTNPECSGMGTTVVAVLVKDNIATIASVGDSRAYLVRGDQLLPLTRDDVWLNETWVRRAFTEDQLARLPLKNVLSKAIGSKEELEFTVQEYPLQDGDLVFLCSDGLHGLVSSEALLETARAHADLTQMAAEMIRLANEAGGKDNITIVAFRYAA